MGNTTKGKRPTFSSEAARAAALKRWANTTPEQRSAVASHASRAQTSEQKAKAGRAGWQSTCNRLGVEEAHKIRKQGSIKHQRAHPSCHELTVAAILKRHSIDYEHITEIDGYSYDFLLPSFMAVILVNGEVHRMFDVEERAARQAKAIDAAHVNHHAPFVVEYDTIEKDMEEVLKFCNIPFRREAEEELIPF